MICKNEEGQTELAKRVSDVHATAVTQRIKSLNCPTSQKLELLDAVIGHPLCQFYLAFFGLGVIHDQIDRCHASDNGHLLGHLPGITEPQDVEPCHLLSNVCSRFAYTFSGKESIIESS